MTTRSNVAALLQAGKSGRLVIFAGAGISVPPPSRLPGWNELQHQVAAALAHRLEDFGPEDWLDKDVETLKQIRQANRFPPEYQAQIIEEACGRRYFEGLQALDVRASNACHRAIAALMKENTVAALVTTNFDRLVELSLDERKGMYQSVIEETDFAAFAAAGPVAGVPPVIKVHGCVSSATSMIDTLKQRMLGRREAVEQAISRLEGFHWLFAGFSAHDLTIDPNYLGLKSLMSRASGGTYLAWHWSSALANTCTDRGCPAADRRLFRIWGACRRRSVYVSPRDLSSSGCRSLKRTGEGDKRGHTVSDEPAPVGCWIVGLCSCSVYCRSF
ncbi:hypothetical protein HB774_34650 (plasmid) [Rhizobium leguminosarum bv. viciae]|nr:hypothetical protein HB774_34650 [Rhizobium leguminosarum bv. viciae]